MPSIKLSLVIPALNEEKVLRASLSEVAQFLKDQDMLETTEVIVVAADCIDGTKNIARAKSKLFTHFQLVEPGKPVGKGRDVRSGVRAASGEFVIFTDADLATPLHHIPTMLQMLEGEAELVIGVRDLANIHDSALRAWSSMLSNLAIRILAVPGVKDTQCGFKGFRKYVANMVFEKQTIMGWGFDIEILAIARKHDFRRFTLDIPDWNDPKEVGDGLAGESQLKAMVKTFVELLKVRFNLIKGVYK